jgi:hypothetical protein
VDFRHAEEDSRVAGGAHGFKLLGCGGHGGLDRGDLAQPALLLCLREPVDKVGVDLLQPRQLGWINPKEWASDARIFVLARGSVVATTSSERHFPQFNRVGEEGVPFLVGRGAVFFARSGGPAAGDKRSMGFDRLSGIDGLWPRVVWMLRWPSNAAPMWMGRPLLTSSVAKKRLVFAVAVCGRVRVAVRRARGRDGCS